MLCKCCNNMLTNLEEQINEWGELETLCDRCILLSRPSLEMDIWTKMLWNAVGSNIKKRIPLWVTSVRRSYGHLVGFEEEPYFDEEAGEWTVNEGRTYIMSAFEEEDLQVTAQSLEDLIEYRKKGE